MKAFKALKFENKNSNFLSSSRIGREGLIFHAKLERPCFTSFLQKQLLAKQ